MTDTLIDSPAWKALGAHHAAVRDLHLRELFESDPGRVERLTPGSYRWYVWPVNANGPAAAAVVQATLDVP